MWHFQNALSFAQKSPEPVSDPARPDLQMPESQVHLPPRQVRGIQLGFPQLNFPRALPGPPRSHQNVSFHVDPPGRGPKNCHRLKVQHVPPR